MIFVYHIEGMHCGSCVEKIKSALSNHYHLAAISLNPPKLAIEAKSKPDLAALNELIRHAGQYQLHEMPVQTEPPAMTEQTSAQGLMAYFPIFLIAGYILLVSLLNNASWQGINYQGLMRQFMAGFFLVFSAFKLLDLHGFADGYATYDLLAKRWHTYGYIYPFLELSLGILYLTNAIPTYTLIFTIVLMSFSSLGVINSLLKKQQFQCACLGTLLKVPLSVVTLVEDLAMVILAALSLFM